MKELLDLFVTFLRIGATTFGGGYAMLPVIQREIVDNKGWASNEEIIDYYAVGQCTPGVIAVNIATFVGCKVKGVAGGIVATFGVIFPPFVIIILIAALINNFQDIDAVKHALAGVRTAVCALVASAVITLFKGGVKDAAGVIIFAAVVAAGIATGVAPLYFVLGGAVLGILISLLRKRGGSK